MLTVKSFPPPLTAAEEQYYLQKYTEGDLEAKHILIEHNLRLVAHIVKKYQTLGEDTEDLLSIGTIGLIKSVVTFNSDKNVRLGTYAARCIEKANPSLRLHFTKRTKKTHLFPTGKFINNFLNSFHFFIANTMVNSYIKLNISILSHLKFLLGSLHMKCIYLYILHLTV